MNNVVRWAIGGALLFAGFGHLTFMRTDFQAQVPRWFPIDTDFVVLASGAVEILLGLALLFLSKHKTVVGWIVVAFFVMIFPGNIAQWREGNNAFGLDTDLKRFGRLFFQPVFIVITLWATNAWAAWRSRRQPSNHGHTIDS